VFLQPAKQAQFLEQTSASESVLMGRSALPPSQVSLALLERVKQLGPHAWCRPWG
jgi:hypothetical protein